MEIKEIERKAMKTLTKSMTGYKATDKDMKCHEFQFELGKWYSVKGDEPLILCERGFHFCQQPSGVWAYYSGPDTRIFKIEAKNVLDTPFEAGTDYKRVCRHIRLIKEITPSSKNNSNTGDRNTGNWNTGNRNTGYSNTGDSNTGDSNTGNSNTGDRNTGNWNTGNRNTGDSNTGYSNTGDSNTGDWNTGDWNLCDYSSGYFCTKDPTIIIFDKPTKIKRANLPHDLISQLGFLLRKDEDFDVEPFLAIPNATKTKIKKLHKKFIEARKGR